jgi:predicted RNA-binding protein Jag
MSSLSVAKSSLSRLIGIDATTIEAATESNLHHLILDLTQMHMAYVRQSSSGIFGFSATKAGSSLSRQSPRVVGGQ